MKNSKQNELKAALEWAINTSPYVGDSTLNESHYAEYMLKNIKNTGEYRQIPHYKSLFRKALRKIDIQKSSIFCEIGAGAGFFTAILSKYNICKKIISIEYSSELVNKVMPFVFSKMNANCWKIQRVIGSFLDIKLKNNTVDCVIANCALHHSHDLNRTLNEIYRILKHKGYFIVMERAHSDDMTDSELNKLLMIEKTKEKALQMYGFYGDHLNREMIGEHEYRIYDWLYHFKNAGLSPIYFDWKTESLFSNKVTKRIHVVVNGMPHLVKVLYDRLISHTWLMNFSNEYRMISLFILKKCMYSDGIHRTVTSNEVV